MKKMKRSSWLGILLWLSCNCVYGQIPFTCEGQVFCILNDGAELAQLSINPVNNAIQFNTVSTGFNGGIEALAFRSADRLLYAIGQASQRLYRIGADGAVEDLGTLPLNPALDYLAGDVTPDGRYLTAIGSLNGIAQSLARIDLEDASFNTTPVTLGGMANIVDIAFDPLTNNLYGYDANSRSILRIGLNNGALTAFPPLGAGNAIQGLFFDAFGRLFGYGSTAFGVASALFAVDKNTGRERLRQTGPVYPISDAASCPSTLDIENRVLPAVTFPCGDLSYTFVIGNSAGSMAGLSLEHALPPGFIYQGLARNPFGGTLDQAALPEVFRLDNLQIPKGVDSIVILVQAGDLPGGDYRSQAVLGNLPPALGSTRRSDDPATLRERDSTAVRINRVDEDSLSFNRFLCLGESLLLDASAYGSNLSWNTGATSTQIVVTEEGLYSFEAVSGCQSIVVSYQVTVATCPFVIELSHGILPVETFPCNEVGFRYVIRNESGISRNGLSLIDTLPEGMSFAGFARNPFGGTLRPGLPPGVIHLEDMKVPVGKDSLELKVAIGPIGPGTYLNRAMLAGLPAALGPVRLSNSLQEPGKDSTALEVLGTGADTLWLDTVVCPGETLVLDGSPYGANYLWSDGSRNARRAISAPGFYELTVFNGCEPSWVFFSVAEGPAISVSLPLETVEIHLGEEYVLSASLNNSGDSVAIEWSGSLSQALSCLDCLAPTAKPLDNTTYTVRVSNGVCADATSIRFLVDKSRRVYAPNVFSPNGDGVNDFFFLQSPDFGILRSLWVFDRWGKPVFYSDQSVMNDAATGWDGTFKGRHMPVGLYAWMAEVEFIGGIIEVLSGELSVLR
jgi:gliding motility-associated-like protein